MRRTILSGLALAAVAYAAIPLVLPPDRDWLALRFRLMGLALVLLNFARPEFVGWHYCGLIDSPILVPRKWDRQHSGIIGGFGEPYPEIRKVLRACTSEMCSIARGRAAGDSAE